MDINCSCVGSKLKGWGGDIFIRNFNKKGV